MSLRLRLFLWKHEFLTIARRKERLLSVLGLLIVFLTFLFKEGLREHQKDLMSAVQEGQNYFAIHDDIHNIEYRLKDIETELARLLPPPNTRLYPWMKNPTVLEGMHNESTLLDIGASLTNLERLAKTLSNKNESKSVAEMRTQFQTLKERNLTALKTLVPPPEDDAEKLRTKVNNATKSTLHEAENELASDERWYETYTVASYILYFLGWSLGVVGKIGGISSLSTQDD